MFKYNVKEFWDRADALNDRFEHDGMRLGEWKKVGIGNPPPNFNSARNSHTLFSFVLSLLKLGRC